MILNPALNTEILTPPRNKAIYLALGILPDGASDILGLWIESTEGAKLWMKVFNDLKTRGVGDILIAVTDGLKGTKRWQPCLRPPADLSMPSSAFLPVAVRASEAPPTAFPLLPSAPEQNLRSRCPPPCGSTRRWLPVSPHLAEIKGHIFTPPPHVVPAMWQISR